LIAILAQKWSETIQSVKLTTRNAVCDLAKPQRLFAIFSNAIATARLVPKGNVQSMIERLTSANSKLIVVPARRGAHAVIFPVVTNYHRMASRPGGLSRQEALRNAQQELRRFVHRTIPTGHLTQ